MKILCLTGTNPYSFERLISYVDQKIAPKYETVIQLGKTNYKTMNATSFDFCEHKELKRLMMNSDIIITQGGYGAICESLELNKKVIAVPRLIYLNESKDDQIEIVEYYSKKNFLVPCYDIKELESLVDNLLHGRIKLKKFKPDFEVKIVSIIDDFLKKNNI